MGKGSDAILPLHQKVMSTCRCSLVSYYVGSGVNSEQVLSVLSMRLLSFVHVCNCINMVVCMFCLCFS